MHSPIVFQSPTGFSPRPVYLSGLSKIITACAFLLVVYAVIMSVWSLQTPAKPEADKLVPSPANIKESTAIYVFLGWMWLSIVVLIYFLRLKVKEIDRLYWSRFFSPEKS